MDSEPQTSEVMKAPRIKRDEAYYRLRQEVEEFLYDEADMLDERRFGDWLNTRSRLLHAHDLQRQARSA